MDISGLDEQEKTAILSREEIEYMEAFIRAELRREISVQNLTHAHIGKKAFPWLKYPDIKIHGIFGHRPTKDPQIRIGEFFNICQSLNLSWPKLILKAIEAARQTSRAQLPPPVKGQPGRPARNRAQNRVK